MSVVKLVEPELTGGKISKERIDELHKLEGSKLIISGLRQDTFEYFVQNYGKCFKEIEFFKCPRVEDLSPLEDLSQLEHIKWFWNLQAERLWDTAKTEKLKVLELKDFMRVRELKEISNSKTLIELEIRGGMWNKREVSTLEPLSQCVALENLSIGTKVADGRVTPISKMPNLNKLFLPANLFTTEQYAWLHARLRDSVNCAEFSPVRKIEEGQAAKGKNGKSLDTIVIGKRKPFLDSKIDANRLDGYIEKYNELLNKFTANPELPEPM